MNTALALPLLFGSVVVFILIGIWVSAREPPRFWMDERRLPKRRVRRRDASSDGPDRNALRAGRSSPSN